VITATAAARAADRMGDARMPGARARKAPRRGSRKSAGSPFLAVVSASIDVVVDALPAVDPVVVPVQP